MESEVDEVTRLRAELAAAQKTIDVLVNRVEVDEQREASLDRHALLHAMAHLEAVIDQRTTELEESQERYEALYTHAPCGVVTVDSEGVITESNQTFGHIVGKVPDELVGTELWSFFAQNDSTRVRRMLSEESQQLGDIELRSRDGRALLSTFAPLPGFDAVQVVLYDVTARRELEAELQHTRRLASIGHLAAGVAHEINNPLAVIQGRVELVDILGVDVPPMLRNHIDIIGRHARRIARIVSSLQAFARPRASQPESVTVKSLVDGALDVAAANLRDVKVEVQIADGVAVHADKWQMERVLVNLFNNAADAMGDRGVIDVSAEIEGDSVVIRVGDEGDGIPDELIDQVFAPFVSGTGKARRMGLGLAITWGIVQDHGGTVRARNRDKGGAEFIIRLPAGEAGMQEPNRPVTRPPTERQDLVLLCIEDEVSIVQLVHQLAGEAGHTVLTAESAEHGLQLVEANSIDVVICDVRLPGMSGIKFRERLRRDHPELARRTILMSGYFQSFGDDDLYIQKPFRVGELLGAIDEAAKR